MNNFYKLYEELVEGEEIDNFVDLIALTEAKLTVTDLHKRDNMEVLLRKIRNNEPIVLNSGGQVVIDPRIAYQLQQLIDTGDLGSLSSRIRANKFTFRPQDPSNTSMYILSDFKKTAEFGGGANQNSKGANATMFNETITMGYIELLVEYNRQPTIDEISNMVGWEQVWENTYRDTAMVAKQFLGTNKGYSYSRDGGFMEVTNQLATSLGFKAKDVWNPSDIWLVKKGKEASFVNQLKTLISNKKVDKNIRIAKAKDLFSKWYISRDCIGISLKKTGKNAKVTEQNVKDIQYTGYKLSSCRLNFEMSGKGKKAKFNTLELSFKINGIINAQMKGYPRALGNNQIELTSKGEGGRLGKIPARDTIDNLLYSFKKRYLKRVEYSKVIKPFFAREMERTLGDGPSKDVLKIVKLYVTVSNSKVLGIVQDAMSKEEFQENLLNALECIRMGNTGVEMDLSAKLQGLYFLFMLAILCRDKKVAEEVTAQLVYGAMKISKWSPPFIKIH